MRRNEMFMLNLPMRDGSGHRSYGISPAVPLEFRFHNVQLPVINRSWAEEMILIAGSVDGLTIPPELRIHPAAWSGDARPDF